MRKLSILLVLACVGCGGSLPAPRMGLAEASCKLQAVLDSVGHQNEALAQRVLDAKLTIAEAVNIIGGLDEDVYAAVDRWRACEPVVAPPPAPGDKVL